MRYSLTSVKTMKKITLKDIAKALNLSTATISKALNDSYEISDATKNIVLAYVKEHNYKPNRFAKSLKNGKTNTIGVIACAINNTFIAQVFEGIQKGSIEYGFDIIIMQSFDNETTERNCLELMLSRGVDGILIAPVNENSNQDLLLKINNNNCPVVFFDRISNEIDTHKVGCNDFLGAYEATKILIKKNRTKIIFINATNFSTNNQRLKGFKKALKDNNIPFHDKYILNCNLDDLALMDQQLKEGFEFYLNEKIIPNAIFGSTEVITTRTLGILAEMNIEVPKQFAVIGFSNTEIAFALNPSLSCIRQPASKIGYIALEKMVELIQNPNPKKHETILLDPEIFERNSTTLV